MHVSFFSQSFLTITESKAGKIHMTPHKILINFFQNKKKVNTNTYVTKYVQWWLINCKWSTIVCIHICQITWQSCNGPVNFEISSFDCIYRQVLFRVQWIHDWLIYFYNTASISWLRTLCWESDWCIADSG